MVTVRLVAGFCNCSDVGLCWIVSALIRLVSLECRSLTLRGSASRLCLMMAGLWERPRSAALPLSLSNCGFFLIL